MTEAKAVSATFNIAPNAKIQGNSTSYGTLKDAYTAVATGGVIQTRAREFIENLILNRAIAIILKGGFDAGYGSQTGYTTVQGKVTVGKGSLVVDRVIIR